MTASTTTPARKNTSHASRAAAKRRPLAPVPDTDPKPSETPKPQAKTKPEPKPAATVDLGARPVTYWFPSAKLSDGTTVSCPHSRYGHESEASARRCIGQLAAQRGHRVS